jgi:hypothetical protein
MLFGVTPIDDFGTGNLQGILWNNLLNKNYDIQTIRSYRPGAIAAAREDPGRRRKQLFGRPDGGGRKNALPNCLIKMRLHPYI